MLKHVGPHAVACWTNEGCSQELSNIRHPANLSNMLQPSSQEVTRSMLRRTISAHRLARVSVAQRLKLRTDLVAALEPGTQGLRKWLSGPLGGWSLPAPRRGPGSPKCGGTLCKLKLEQAVPGAAQTACRPLDVDNAELAWIIRARHGSDKGPRDKRAPTRATARRFARGVPGVS